MTTLFIHAGLDLTGGAAFWCIFKGCSNPAHQHRPLVKWIASSPRARFALMIAQALVVGKITMMVVG